MSFVKNTSLVLMHDFGRDGIFLMQGIKVISKALGEIFAGLPASLLAYLLAPLLSS